MPFEKNHLVPLEWRVKSSKANKARLLDPRNHWNYGNRLPRPFCLDCGKELKELGSKRCRSCAEKIKPKACGTRCNLWKDGQTSLHILIRTSPKYITWRNTVFKRDNYICRKCGKHVNYLEVHHIISFKNLLENFIKLYNQFSPLEEKEILFRLALKHEPFWNIENGETLCKMCHKEKTWPNL